jgi:aromatic-L-amino-acid/L-tryptophan decarboxylase
MRETRTPADVPLSFDTGEFRQLGHTLVDRIAELMERLPDRAVVPTRGPEELRALIGGAAPLPPAGSAASDLLDEAVSLLFENSTFNAHPMFYGYITAPPAPIGVLADLLASAVNANCGSATLGPMAAEIETQTIRWISELIGYRPDAGGILVSGGNVANFTCILAARAAAAGEGVRQDGLEPGWHLYASRETHTWVQKAADLFGLGTQAIRWIDVDADQRMRVAALRDALDEDARRGGKPLAVIATAGTVSTGAVDPLGEIADLCNERGIWLHVDGAYGGFAACAPDVPADLKLLARADSVAVDPHKWLYAPLEAGCALVKDQDSLRRAFSYHPAYYHFGTESTNFVDLGFQNSRGFRALKVWLALRHAGRAGYARMIGDDIRLTQHLHRCVGEHPDLDPFTLGLSISTFRYVPPELRGSVGQPAGDDRLNALNEALLDRLQKEGKAFVSNAVVNGQYLLRACIVNINTTRNDVERLPEIIVETGRRVFADIF